MQNTVEQKLNLISAIQKIDTELVTIEALKGELPKEVKTIHHDIAHLQTRQEKLKTNIIELEQQAEMYKQQTHSAENLIALYTNQLIEVQNHKDHEKLAKEIDLQKVEVRLFEKRLKQTYGQLEEKQVGIKNIQQLLEQKLQSIEAKEKNLEVLNEEHKTQETQLKQQQEQLFLELKKQFPELAIIYQKIKKKLGDTPAVVPVQRQACGGCSIVVPPQKQEEIKEKKKIITCDYCGRILTHVIDEGIEESTKE